MTPAQRSETLADLDQRNTEDLAKRLFYALYPDQDTVWELPLRQLSLPLQRRQMRSPVGNALPMIVIQDLS